MHDVWGRPIRTVHRGWAADPEVRFNAAAGGALTALGVFLIDSGKVDAVLHVRASTEKPMLTDAQISTTSLTCRPGMGTNPGLTTFSFAARSVPMLSVSSVMSRAPMPGS